MILGYVLLQIAPVVNSQASQAFSVENNETFLQCVFIFFLLLLFK